MKKFRKKLWAGLAVLALLSPLGIFLPKAFNSGGAWGEWGSGELRRLLGYLPEGMRKYTGLWKAPVHDYNMGGAASTSLQALSYIASGVLGVFLAGVAIYFLMRVLGKHGK
ncbi:MAG TPA: hypothetical protein VF790_13075 [Dissulfurispiraceae bacterium]